MSVGIIRNLGGGSSQPKIFFLYNQGDMSGSGGINRLFSFPGQTNLDSYRKVIFNADNVEVWAHFWVGNSNTRAGFYPTSLADFTPYSKLRVEMTIVKNASEGIHIAYSPTIPTFDNNNSFNSTEFPLLTITDTSGVHVYECDISTLNGYYRYVIEGSSLFAGQSDVTFYVHKIWLEK